MIKKLAVGAVLFPWSLVAVLLVGLFTGGAVAQDDEEEEAPPRWVAKHEHDGTDITKRVIFVVDSSGSMAGNSLDYAINAVAHIMASFPDAGWIKVVSFADESDVFDATDLPDLKPDEKDANNYIALPNAEAITAIHRWLYEKGSSGNTFIFPALERTFAENPETDRSVAIVSDFDFSGYDDAHRAKFTLLFEKHKIPFHTIGIDPGKRASSLMLWIAETTDGECVVLRPSEPPAVPEPTPH